MAPANYQVCYENNAVMVLMCFSMVDVRVLLVKYNYQIFYETPDMPFNYK
jgi:hypothetical protein